MHNSYYPIALAEPAEQDQFNLLAGKLADNGVKVSWKPQPIETAQGTLWKHQAYFPYAPSQDDTILAKIKQLVRENIKDVQGKFYLETRPQKYLLLKGGS